MSARRSTATKAGRPNIVGRGYLPKGGVPAAQAHNAAAVAAAATLEADEGPDARGSASADPSPARTSRLAHPVTLYAFAAGSGLGALLGSVIR